MVARWLLAGAAAFAAVSLGGCGGGGGGGGGSSGGGSAAPTTPVTSPAPAPTPTPEPTSPSDYARDFSYTTGLGYVIDLFYPDDNIGSTGIAATILDSSLSVSLRYTANPELVVFGYGTGQVSFIGSDLKSAGPQRYYQRADETLLLGLEADGATTYVSRAAWQTIVGAEVRMGRAGTRRITRYGLVGPITPSGTAIATVGTYTGTPFAIGGLVDTPSLASTQRASVSITGTDNRVAGSILIFQTENQSQVQKASLRLEGTLDRTGNAITGTITDTAFGLSGTFRGALFGPDARNVGLVFRVSDASANTVFVGDFAGVR